MHRSIKRLGDAELEIMQIIWREETPVTSTFVLEKLHGRQWKLPTLMTTLARLANKGFLLCDRSTRTNYYSALVSEADYQTAEGAQFLHKLYGNSLRGFVANLYDSKTINQDDIEELRRYLDSFEEGK